MWKPIDSNFRSWHTYGKWLLTRRRKDWLSYVLKFVSESWYIFQCPIGWEHFGRCPKNYATWNVPFPLHDYDVFFCAFQVNSEVVTLPLLREPYIYVERQTNTILLNTNIGLKVCSVSLLLFPPPLYLQNTTYALTPSWPPLGSVERTIAPGGERAGLLQEAHLRPLRELQQLLPGRPAHAQRTNQPVRGRLWQQLEGKKIWIWIWINFIDSPREKFVGSQ